jgi:hypothetical protein
VCFKKKKLPHFLLFEKNRFSTFLSMKWKLNFISDYRKFLLQPDKSLWSDNANVINHFPKLLLLNHYLSKKFKQMKNNYFNYFTVQSIKAFFMRVYNRTPIVDRNIRYHSLQSPAFLILFKTRPLNCRYGIVESSETSFSSLLHILNDVVLQKNISTENPTFPLFYTSHIPFKLTFSL